MNGINASTHDASVWPPLNCIVFTDRAFVRTHENVSVGSRSNGNLEVLVFTERGNPEYMEKNPSGQRREQTTNSTHIWLRRWDSNSGLIGGRRVWSPLRHPCSFKCNFFFNLMELLIFLIIFLLC